MTVTATAKRRRRQAANGYNHIAKLGRPIYKKTDSSTASRKLAAMVARENERRQRGAK